MRWRLPGAIGGAPAKLFPWRGDDQRDRLINLCVEKGVAGIVCKQLDIEARVGLVEGSETLRGHAARLHRG